MSYFAMHSSALALLLKKDISPKTHKGTLNQLAKEYVNTGLFPREIYEYIDGGLAIRKKSSYDYSAVLTRELAEEYIDKAEKFIGEVELLL